MLLRLLLRFVLLVASENWENSVGVVGLYNVGKSSRVMEVNEET